MVAAWASWQYQGRLSYSRIILPRITPISSKEFIKFLEYVGCTQSRQKGSHISFTRSDLKRPVIVQANTELPVFIIRNNLRTLKISHDEYLDSLKKI